ncbi:CLUMA_CG008728, isoform A [Clunio marinus]|uniref:CLUMA_CG008728, isoform A n=1 Tax=Clunio marinus TaxID=568069 RepID=A0A1J1I4Y9_9DIPT|nr:CLUMA_CG008728, isoform A [Clunio marinus]
MEILKYFNTTKNYDKENDINLETISSFSRQQNSSIKIVYATVSPESVVVPIVSCIFAFPFIALLALLFLRKCSKACRRFSSRNENYQDQNEDSIHFNRIHRHTTRKPIYLYSCNLSREISSKDLETVIEESSEQELADLRQTFNLE